MDKVNMGTPKESLSKVFLKEKGSKVAKIAIDRVNYKVGSPVVQETLDCDDTQAHHFQNIFWSHEVTPTMIVENLNEEEFETFLKQVEAHHRIA